jgi:thiaminase/transcriptional activator TenA
MSSTTESVFSRAAWEQNAGTYDVIRTMPFNAELAAGTLSEARFKHYITQDAHYLIGFGRALTGRAKAPTRTGLSSKSAEGDRGRALHVFFGALASRKCSRGRR